MNPRIHGQLGGLAISLGCPDVVVQDIDSTEALYTGRHDGFTGHLIGDICHHTECRMPVRLHGMQGVRQPLGIDVHQQQCGAFLRESLSRRPPIPYRLTGLLPGPNNNGHFACKPT
jgi:hypothetical protein